MGETVKTESDDAGGLGRLPVNPRRHRVRPEERRRVVTACNNCNVRRIKCSGEHPCRHCSQALRICEYPTRVEKVFVPRAELDALRARCAALERGLAESVPDAFQRDQLLSRVARLPSAGPAITSPDSLSSRGDLPVDDDGSPPPSDGKLLHDLDGTARYLGETSGATFLDNLKQFMATTLQLTSNATSAASHAASGAAGAAAAGTGPAAGVGQTFLRSVGSYQTSDSRPLAAPAVEPLWLPPRDDMVRRRALPGRPAHPARAAPRGPPASSPPPSASESGYLVAHRRLAFHHAAFAYATLLCLASPGSKRDGQLGEHFFARARALIQSPLDISTYTSDDVAAMAMMGLYLLEMNRRDACYMYVAVAMHVSVMHGIHRGWSVDERGKRVFWTLYILDRWVSCLMGRPPTILDEAITLPPPADFPGLPSCIGLRANVKLARISGYIVCNTFRVAPSADASDRQRHSLSHVDHVLGLLDEWLHGLPPELQLPDEPFARDRPLYTLHMSYNQLKLLTIRPIFFQAVKKAVADRFMARRWSIEEHPQIARIRETSEAARCNLRLGLCLQRSSPDQKLTMADLHAIFNATTILLLHQIAFVNLRTLDLADVAFGIAAFEREAALGGAYGQDCLRVLRGLAELVQRLRKLMFEDDVAVAHAHAHAHTPPDPAPAPPVLVASMALAATHNNGSSISSNSGSSIATTLLCAASALLPSLATPVPAPHPWFPAVVPVHYAAFPTTLSLLAQAEVQQQCGDEVYQELTSWATVEDFGEYFCF